MEDVKTDLFTTYSTCSFSLRLIYALTYLLTYLHTYSSIHSVVGAKKIVSFLTELRLKITLFERRGQAVEYDKS